MQISSSPSIKLKNTNVPAPSSNATDTSITETRTSSAPSVETKADLSKKPSSTELRSLADFRNIFESAPTRENSSQQTSEQKVPTESDRKRFEQIAADLASGSSVSSPRPVEGSSVAGPGGAAPNEALAGAVTTAAAVAGSAAPINDVDATVSNEILALRLKNVRENPDDPKARALLRGATSSFLRRGQLDVLDPSIRESVLDELLGARTPHPEGGPAIDPSVGLVGRSLSLSSHVLANSENPQDRNSPEFIALRDQFRDSVNGGVQGGFQIFQTFGEEPEPFQNFVLDQLGITDLQPGELEALSAKSA